MLRNERLRLFVGTALPPLLANDLHERISSLLPASSDYRITPTAQLHVTAMFIGNRDPTLLPSIRERVAHVASITDPITITHGRIFSMPKRSPYMAWVRFRPHKALTTLHHALANALGSPPSVYVPYWPHITLARGNGALSLPQSNEDIVEQFHIDCLTLFRSHRDPGGSQHSVIEQWPLERCV
ncbi:MAG: RNA 2',3'-cyclic phosphodiesterase [Flavobacteriales bacterium]|nr:RNA 2',3'-cyclic phosphodiesterase [Flavobacteriales bacterium]MBK6945105.1 RNA 2',3'-cyclic phosphodiesterase [Flavobacteriales bacterium]MBK9535338.1 RNA 2',3'-cyclic phosphodiesterase [Flavobacteriales bacterium]MBP9137547.1 RNA 2',3'-cyclic phosphodiesterase [Flavobacteriales bacterium]HQV51485.1 RNA 2',3'-cyclic phosphodiesterase [Flavobacteriales bacterium]